MRSSPQDIWGLSAAARSSSLPPTRSISAPARVLVPRSRAPPRGVLAPPPVAPPRAGPAAPPASFSPAARGKKRDAGPDRVGEDRLAGRDGHGHVLGEGTDRSGSRVRHRGGGGERGGGAARE